MPVDSARELVAAELDLTLNPAEFGFQTTAELQPLDETVGQPRALRAIDLGLGLKTRGYHIYLSGVPGSGKMETARRTLTAKASLSPPAGDWVYVNNFDEPDQPQAISLKAGQGGQLKRDMTNLVTRLLDELPKAFQREDFSREKDRLRQHYKQQADEIFAELERMAKDRQVTVQQLGDGQILFQPLKDGKPILAEEAQHLTPEETEEIERRQRELIEATEGIAQRQQEVERQLNADVRQVERTFASRVIEPLLNEIAHRYDNGKVGRWLDRLKAHFIKNLDRFRRRADRLQWLSPEAGQGEPLVADLQERFFEYQVNVFVDNSEAAHAPVVIESAPTYRNLFGTIDRVVDRFGRVVTNFTRIKAGSLMRANGGHLVIDLEDALSEPFVWKILKRTIKSGLAEIESYDPFSLFTISGIKPEPIPLDVKLVVIGSPLLYHLLYLYDDDFREIFKVKAEFDTEIPLDPTAPRIYGRLVKKLSVAEGVPDFDTSAIAELIRASSRMAGDRTRLTSEFRRVADLIREAGYWAHQSGAQVVTGDTVRQTLREQTNRSDLFAEKIRDMIRDGTLLVSLGESVVGQVNGLTVADLGDYAFGWPARITASVGVGSEGVVNIEREARLSGRTFDKGLLILEGYLRNQYARERPLSLSASLAMEQSYGGVDGDSATLAELLCLLSAISGLPLRQDIAVTGSANQWGQVQAIGGVNEKVEGFFDVCRQHGLTGKQGVCLPASNVKHLVLRHDVLDAIRRGEFHLWSVVHLDQALTLLTGCPAGDLETPETVHHRVAGRLQVMASALKEQGAGPTERTTRLRDTAEPPAKDPRPPLPGQDSDGDD